MQRRDQERQQVFAVLRYDPEDCAPDIERHVTVKEIVWSLDLAQAEVTRLNQLNAAKGVRYFWQATRLYRPGTAAG